MVPSEDKRNLSCFEVGRKPEGGKTKEARRKESEYLLETILVHQGNFNIYSPSWFGKEAECHVYNQVGIEPFKIPNPSPRLHRIG